MQRQRRSFAVLLMVGLALILVLNWTNTAPANPSLLRPSATQELVASQKNASAVGVDDKGDGIPQVAWIMSFGGSVRFVREQHTLFCY